MSLERFSKTGLYLLSESNVSRAHDSFIDWVRDVASWLDDEFPDSGRSAEWSSLGTSMLIIGGIASSTDISRWIHFQQIVENRLAWLAKVAKSKQDSLSFEDDGESDMPSIFMCHSSKDKFFVRELAEKLSEYGFDVWIDEAELNIGDSLIGKIGAAIEDVDYVGVVLSSNSIESEWVQHELNLAMQREFKERKVIVLPLLLEKVDIPPFLRNKVYADFTTPKLYGDTFPKLLRSMKVADDDIDKVPSPVEETEEAPKLSPSEEKLASFENVTIRDLDNDRAYRPDPEKLLYRIYFNLSSAPPIEWQDIFEAERKFPRHTKWRKAWIEGDYIVVHCVPEEVEKYHFPDLLQDTENSNNKYRRYLMEEAEREIKELGTEEDERHRLDDLRDRLGFN